MSLSIRDKICKDSLMVLEHNKVTRPEKYRINLFGMTFIQYSNVFPSDIFKDVEVFTPHVIQQSGKNFLEIGVGNGITSVISALQGKKVTGVDINIDAIENANENARLHNVEQHCYFFESNHFENVNSERFDTVYWNLPFCDQYEAHDNLSKSILDFNYSTLTVFLNESSNYLKPGSNLILGYSNIIGNRKSFSSKLDAFNFSKKSILVQEFVEWNDNLFDLTLYELKI